MLMAATQPARIVERRGTRYWTCPSCGKTLAELSGRHVIIKVRDRFLVIALVNDQIQRCPNPKCGAASMLRAA